jgi:hypothetical protein
MFQFFNHKCRHVISHAFSFSVEYLLYYSISHPELLDIYNPWELLTSFCVIANSIRSFHRLAFNPAAFAGVLPSSAMCGFTKLYAMRCPSASGVYKEHVKLNQILVKKVLYNSEANNMANYGGNKLMVDAGHHCGLYIQSLVLNELELIL